MLIKFFRSSYLIQYIILFLIALTLGGSSLIYPVDVMPSRDIYPFYSIIYFWLGDFKILFSVMGFIFLFFETLMINNIITENKIVPKNSLLPGFLYVILMSFSPELLTLHPVLIANFFLILILNLVFKIYGQKKPFTLLYKLGLILGVASFFYFPVYLFLIFIFWFLFFLRSLSWRELMIPVVGLITPYIFLVVWYFCFDQLEFVYYDYLKFFQSTELIDIELNIITKMILGIFAILFLFSMIYFAGGKYYEKSISTRKKLKLSFSLLIISFIPIILYGGSMINSLTFLAIPVVVFTSSYLSELKKTYFPNLIIILLILLILINNYHLLDFI